MRALSRILPFSPPCLSFFPHPVGLCPWRFWQRLVDLHLVISRPTLRRAESRHRRRRRRHHRRSTTPSLSSSPSTLSSFPPFRFIEWNVRSVVPACPPACHSTRSIAGLMESYLSFALFFPLSVYLSLSFIYQLSRSLCLRLFRAGNESERVTHQIAHDADL